MNLSNKGLTTNKDEKLNTLNKITTLNPNAAEFVPSFLRISPGSTNNTDGTRIDSSGKAVFNRSESSISNNSDDEVHQYWRRQLPDDITPDFKMMGDEVQEAGNLSLESLSIHDGLEAPRFSPLASTTHLLSKRLETSSNGNDATILGERLRYSVPAYGEDQSSAAFLNLPTNPWDKQFINGDQHFTNGRESHPYSGDSGAGYLNDLLNENTVLDDTEINPVEFLASQFPGFAAESLAEVYYANGCDLNLTIEMLTQLELQVDVGLNQNITTKTMSAPNLSTLDFPALGAPDSQIGLTKYDGDDLHQAAGPYHPVDEDNLLFKSDSSGISRGAIDYASAVRKIASQDSGQWKYERNGSTADMNAGTSRVSRVGHAKSLYGDRVQGHGTSRASPVWLETGEAVANMYSELREEARDHARVRNAYFEQAGQAYRIGNKALAKELSVKGQFHNMQMKVAHGKAKESIYQHRNPMGPELQSYGRGHEPIIDLHGLHVREAIHILKQEMSILRSKARSAGQHLHVLICVGTGHHTKGSRTPARLPEAVKYFLVEEGLKCTEPQPGLLRVVIY